MSLEVPRNSVVHQAFTLMTGFSLICKLGSFSEECIFLQCWSYHPIFSCLIVLSLDLSLRCGCANTHPKRWPLCRQPWSINTLWRFHSGGLMQRNIRMSTLNSLCSLGLEFAITSTLWSRRHQEHSKSYKGKYFIGTGLQFRDSIHYLHGCMQADMVLEKEPRGSRKSEWQWASPELQKSQSPPPLTQFLQQGHTF